MKRISNLEDISKNFSFDSKGKTLYLMPRIRPGIKNMKLVEELLDFTLYWCKLRTGIQKVLLSIDCEKCNFQSNYIASLEDHNSPNIETKIFNSILEFHISRGAKIISTMPYISSNKTNDQHGENIILEYIV